MPSLPSVTGTWRHRVNQSLLADDDEAHRALAAYLLKESFIGGGSDWTDSSGNSVSGPARWRVIASSNGTTASAADNWADETDCVWESAGTAHSWIVLQHATYFDDADPLEICLDLSEASSATRNGTMGVYLSRSGFDVSTPSLTARPTAADEVEVLATDGTMTTAAWQGADTNDEDHRVGRLHFQMTVDGLQMRAFIMYEGACVATWILFRMDDWLDDATIPALMLISSRDSDAEINTWTIFQSNTYAQWVSRDTTAGGVYRCRMCMPVATGSNTAASAFAACNIGGVSSSGLHAIDLQGITPASGYVTSVPDLWIGRAANAGLHYPDDGSRTMAQLGILATPWNGVQILLS